MSEAMPQVPAGDGQHPIMLVMVSAARQDVSIAFYRAVFGWDSHPLTDDLVIADTPAGPRVAYQTKPPAGFPGVVPMIRVDDIDTALASIVAAGGVIEAAGWEVPMIGRLARFRDPSATLYGLIQPSTSTVQAPMAMPFGDNPKPPAGSVCSLEMYAKAGEAAAGFFRNQFGWGCAETMPQYMGFNPAAGTQGVFQTHTPSQTAVAYIYVDNVAGTMGDIDVNGGSRIGEPMSMPGMGTFGYFSDPSGSVMGLIGP